MRQAPASRAHRRAPASLPLGILAGVLVAACSSTAPAPVPVEQPPDEPVQRVTDRLIDAARQRCDINSMRVCLHEIREIEPDVPEYVISSRGDDLAYLEEEFYSEFLVALSTRVNLIDVDFGLDDTDPRLMETPVEDVAHRLGATHVVVGDFKRRGNDILINVRMVDTASHVIVAAARGVVPLKHLSDKSRLALNSVGHDDSQSSYLASLRAARPELQPTPTSYNPYDPAAFPPPETVIPASGELVGEGTIIPRTLPSDDVLEVVVPARKSSSRRAPAKVLPGPGPAEQRLRSMGRELKD